MQSILTDQKFYQTSANMPSFFEGDKTRCTEDMAWNSIKVCLFVASYKYLQVQRLGDTSSNKIYKPEEGFGRNVVLALNYKIYQYSKLIILIHYVCDAHFHSLWRRKFVVWKS